MYLNRCIYSIIILTLILVHQSYLSEPSDKNVTVLQKSIAKEIPSEGGVIKKYKPQTSSGHVSNPRVNTSQKQNASTNATTATLQPVSFHEIKISSSAKTPQKVNKTDILKSVSISPNVSSSTVKSNLNDTKLIITNRISSTTTEEPRKPLKTVHDEIAPMDIKSEQPPPKASSLDPTLSDKNIKRANYVVPIVAVILSAPLVAYVISVLYKRGSDWWQHRNYRRMDYLIEGMYNS